MKRKRIAQSQNSNTTEATANAKDKKNETKHFNKDVDSHSICRSQLQKMRDCMRHFSDMYFSTCTAHSNRQYDR